MQYILEKLHDLCKEYGLNIHFNKTKLMVLKKYPPNYNNITLILTNTVVKAAQAYRYLGTWIELALSIFIKLRMLFTSRDVNIGLRMRMLRCYVFSIALYGVEEWTRMDKLQAFEMWCFGRIWRIPWTDRVINTQVLNIMH